MFPVRNPKADVALPRTAPPRTYRVHPQSVGSFMQDKRWSLIRRLMNGRGLDRSPHAVVARAMATGALERAGVDLAIAVTGIAGPGGATPAKPVSLVHMAAAVRDRPVLHAKQVLPGDRTAVRLATVNAALQAGA